MSQPTADPGSFRDPAGRVFHVEGRVLRSVSPSAAAEFDKVRATGLVDALVDKGWLVRCDSVDREALGEAGAGAGDVLEHPRLPFISYPYEWPFAALQAAAVLHLDVHLEALAHGVHLSDSSAYNVQFVGAKPIFIDPLSLRPYREGEIWAGHRQFCEQFVAPMLLRAKVGIAPNAWYRGTQEGIPVAEVNRLLPLRAKASLQVLTHVVGQSYFDRRAQRSTDAMGRATTDTAAKLPKSALEQMLRSLRDWVAGLTPRGGDQTTWQEYERFCSYSPEELDAKRKFIAAFAGETRPKILLDLGCNVGGFSTVALEAGVEYAIGFDADHGALDAGFERARTQNLPFLPLFMDLANPSPAQGWAQRERKGVGERLGQGAVLALGLVHHLAIARNVPLPMVLDWLTALGRSGVVEFVPKQDPMVVELLRNREDVFPDYETDAFRRELSSRARVVREEAVTGSGRRLFWWERS